MNADTVIAALRARATAALHTKDGSAPPPISSQYLERFAEALIVALSPNQTRGLLDFIQSESPVNPDIQQLSSEFQQARLRFVQDELSLSNEPADKLTHPSGPLDAGLGLILHIDHYNPEDAKNYHAGEFWDTNNATIQFLAQKGLSKETTSCMDWHSRAVASSLGCPVKHWGKELQARHDAFAFEVLQLIPCPFLVIGGACPWNSYTSGISEHCREIVFNLSDEVEIRMVLEYDSSGTAPHRMTFKIDHPAYLFRANPSLAMPTALRFDAQINFVMWLSGFRFVEQSAEIAAQNIRYRRIRAAPFPMLYAYRALEAQSGRILSQGELDNDFIHWARRYIGRDIKEYLDGSKSLIDLLCEEHCQRFSAKMTAVSGEASRQELTEGLIRTLNRRKKAARGFVLFIRGISLNLPYLKEDTQLIMQQDSLEVVISISFATDDPPTNVCAPSARREDPAFWLRILCTYNLETESGLRHRQVWLTQSSRVNPHLRLFQVNTIADHMNGRTKEYILSQPHRFINESLYKRDEYVQGSFYTVCKDSDCGSCISIRKRCNHQLPKVET